MPAAELGEHFDDQFGRPTKELDSMAGPLLIMEFKDWTVPDAAEAYMFDVATQYALNLRPENQSMCERTIEHEQFCRNENIELISPTSGKCPAEHADPEAITQADFQIEIRDQADDDGRIIPTPTCTDCSNGR